MQRIISIISIACLGLMLAACSGDKVKGDGKITTTIRNVAKFSQLEVEGNLNVVVNNQQTSSLAITTDSNIAPHVMTTVEKDTLKVYPQKGYNLSPSQPIRIHIALPKIEKVSVAGNSVVDVSGVNSAEFDVEVEGNSKLALSGKVKQVEYEIEGAAEIDGRHLLAEKVKLEASGSSQAAVYATKKLDVKINGSGKVTYYGKPPVINQAVFGDGKLISAGKN